MVFRISDADDISDAKRSDDKGDDDKAESHRFLLSLGSPDPTIRDGYRYTGRLYLRER
jgi:hypothetical protein